MYTYLDGLLNIQFCLGKANQIVPGPAGLGRFLWKRSVDLSYFSTRASTCVCNRAYDRDLVVGRARDLTGRVLKGSIRQAVT